MPNFIFLPCVDMREGPSQETRRVSQALFGEEVEVLKSHEKWFFIKTPDNYTGWVKEGIVAKDRPCSPDLEVSRLQAHVYARADTEFGPLLTLAFGSKLECLETDSRWHQILLPDARKAYIQRGDVETEVFELSSFSKKFLGLPYTWGGRCSFGFDCSGYIQMLYSRLGFQLPRDARQQVHCGASVASLTLGDLIFWGYSHTDIRHVGMFLEGDTFIHTSVRENKPYLRLSKISDPEWNGSGLYSYSTARRILVQEGESKRHCETDWFDRSARI